MSVPKRNALIIKKGVKKTNELQIFKYENNEIRTVQKDGQTWWVLKDVCDVLGLSDTNKVADRLDDDELTRAKFVSGGQTRDMYIISEGGLYNVISRSDKEEAKGFKRWVNHEVLPTIRKHGAYMTPDVLEKALLNPDVHEHRKCQRKIEKKLAVDTSNTGDETRGWR